MSAPCAPSEHQSQARSRFEVSVGLGRPTRRSILRRGALPIAALLGAGCRPISGLLIASRSPPVVDVIVFGGMTLPVLGLRRAADAVNRQRLGFDIRISVLPPVPGPGVVSTAGGPTPTPFVPSAAGLKQLLASGSGLGRPGFPAAALVTAQADLPPLVDRRLIEPVDRVWALSRSEASSDFAPGALEAVKVQGRTAALPLGAWVHVLYYDPSLFEAASFGPPKHDWTWAEFATAAQRLTHVDGDRQWALLAHDEPYLLLSLLWSHGGVAAADGKRWMLDEAAAMDAVRFWADLVTRRRVAPIPPGGQRFEWRMDEHALWAIAWDAVSGREVGTRLRLAMHLAVNRYLTLSPQGAPVGAPRTISITDLPKARQRATGLGLTGALVLLSTSPDLQLVARACLALVGEVVPSAGSSWGMPVYHADAALIRQADPGLTPEEAAVISRALSYSRALPPEFAPRVIRVLRANVMEPILAHRASIEAAVRDASNVLNNSIGQ